MDYHDTGEAMARVLVQYMPDDAQIQREIAASLDSKIELRTITAIRESHKRRIARSPRDQDNTVVWMDERYKNDMTAASQRLAMAVLKARVAA